MNPTSKNRMMIWIIVILIFTNLSTIGSFYYHRMKEAKTSDIKHDDPKSFPGEQRTRFFREQLNLNDEQLNAFRDINRHFNQTARGIEMNLAQLRVDLINELGSQNSDSTRLNDIANEVGNNHRELKQVTIAFYLDMKKKCTAEQQAKLHEIFQAMLNKDTQINLPQPGNQSGRWRNK
ncbi:MAG: periplasmic heavy metal sensor [Salinivirgaceae bacterium]|jgi:Spy/CpxP family protein refolding chaperone